jgi:hypothetical protein
MERGFLQVFDWGFIASFAVASTAVVAIANTLRQWWNLEPRWSALVAAEVLAFYAAGIAQPSFTIGRFFQVLAFGVLLCCYAAGIQATVAGLSHRITGVRAATPAGFWAPWFKA